MNTRNLLILIGAVAVPVVVLIVIGSILNVLAPLAITAAVAFVLGRLSVHFNLLDTIRGLRPAKTVKSVAQAAQKAAAPVMRSAEKALDSTAPVKAAEKPAPASKAASEAAPANEPPPTRNDLLDPEFEIKTPEQIEQEARLREQEIRQRAQGAPTGDVSALLEERRKRLLGGEQGEQ